LLTDATVTILAGAEQMMRGKRRQVKRKWPRWLTPMCISKPSSVVDCGQNTAPGSKTINGIMLSHIVRSVVLSTLELTEIKEFWCVCNVCLSENYNINVNLAFDKLHVPLEVITLE
jgi:hypothetical protein